MKLSLREQVFGEIGFTKDMTLSPDEMNVFRACVNEHWLAQINHFHPELNAEAKSSGIENYHRLAHKMDHKKTWPKQNRVLPQTFVKQIKNLGFIAKLKEEFGDFTISDIMDPIPHPGEPEIYWRLVRPNVAEDIGPLHKDTWFHGALNSGYGAFPKDKYTIKVWIPIFCEPGKSGLALAAGSHLKEWKYHIHMDNGYPRIIHDDDLSQAGAKLIPTEPGNLLIFNENMLHGGVVNEGDKTRVSAEITMVLQRESFIL